AAAEKAIPLLVKGAEGHVEKRSCFACHNQAFPVMALAAAKSRGFDVADERFTTQAEHIAEFLSQNREKFQKGQGTGGQVDTAGYAMLTLELAGHEPDETTRAVVEYLLKFPGDRDHWRTSSNRPPTAGWPCRRAWPAPRTRPARRWSPCTPPAGCGPTTPPTATGWRSW